MTQSNDNNSEDDFWNEMGANTPEPKKVTQSQPTSVAITEPTLTDASNGKFVDVVATVPTAVVPTPITALPVGENIVFKSKKFSPNDIPEIRLAEILPTEYMSLVDHISDVYASLPKLEYNNIYKEIKDLAVQSEPTPDAQSINALLERCQASKDRLSVIFLDVQRCYIVKKRNVDILRDIWSKYSNAKSADQRKSEANNIVANFEIDLGYVEALYKTCDHSMKMLDGLHDDVSRRITIMQVCLKHFDLARGASPDFSFKVFSSKLNINEIESNKEIDSSKGIEAEEQSFLNG